VAEIVLENVSKRYPDGVVAVDRFGLEIADGEFIILVGPSGCGKSTVLNMVAGLEDITEGTVRIGGEVVNGREPRERDIAMVFQSYALYPHMSVRENMSFPLKLAGLDRPTIQRQVEETAAMLGLTRHLDRKPAHLSGGQRQRVAMGRAIVRKPNAFLMDEPLSNLDAKLRVEMRRQVSSIQKRLGTTTIYVTHDQTEAMTLGDRVVVMRRGVIQQVASPQHLYHSPVNVFVAGFIGSPAMNFLPGRVDGDTLRSPLGDATIPGQLVKSVQERGIGGEVILGIRPEHFATAASAGDAPGGRLTASIDGLEPIGADEFAYFTVEGAMVDSPELRELAIDAGDDELGEGQSRIVCRLDAASGAAEGDPLELWYDTARIHIFDAQTGANLTARHASTEL
jgi:multiple sugar transport system ATP-binding protein